MTDLPLVEEDRGGLLYRGATALQPVAIVVELLLAHLLQHLRRASTRHFRACAQTRGDRHHDQRRGHRQRAATGCGRACHADEGCLPGYSRRAHQRAVDSPGAEFASIGWMSPLPNCAATFDGTTIR